MNIFITIKRTTLIYLMCVLILLCIFAVTIYNFFYNVSQAFSEEEILPMIQQIFYVRNKAIMEKNNEFLKSLYDTERKYGIWAYEHEVKKMKYLHKWSEKQGIKFTDINSNIEIRYIKEKNSGITVNFIASTEYKYIYENQSQTVNLFRIGTYHSIDLVPKTTENFEKIYEDDEQIILNREDWVITREWYTDPFADSLNLDDIKSEEIKTFILSYQPTSLKDISERRLKAVEYADKYCGAANSLENGYHYNKQYKDYNSLGGDCANFASQILYEGGKFKKTYDWNYSKGGSKAWVNAHAFKNYMMYSGRASRIAYGTYNQVYKASYKLMPGDFIAYEKKGKVTHISVVTGVDSKGYVLVNCHNTDRYRVPWDLGWSDKNIKFWLMRMHY